MQHTQREHATYAVGAATEGILRLGVRIATGCQHGDVLGGVVGHAPHLVERARVLGIKRADRGVRSDTGRPLSRGVVDVARPLLRKQWQADDRVSDRTYANRTAESSPGRQTVASSG